MVELFLIDAKWNKKIELNKEQIKKISKFKNILLCSSVNFLNNINCVKKILEENKIKTSLIKTKRTKEKGQILGCNSYGDFLNEKFDCILYIGDGYFHVDALLFAQIYSKNKIPVFRLNPKTQEIENISFERIEKKVKKIKANLIKYLSSKSIGILVSTKKGQEYLNQAILLKKELEEKGKKAFIFLGDTFDLNKSEDFNFIDCWVNSACPRIGQEDCINVSFPIVNIKEAFNPEKYLTKF